jgi:hypothetical protein
MIADRESVESPQGLARDLFALGAALVVAIPDVPPASFMRIENGQVIACAWCPRRLGEPRLKVRVICWAQERGMQVSHGICEVCAEAQRKEI